MSKLITAKEKTGKSWYLIAPSIETYSFIKKNKNVTFLEIFYSFAPKLLNKRKIDLTEEKKKEFILRVIFQLDNRVQQLIFFARETQKYGKKIINKKGNKKICSYKPYQLFLACLTAYLNTIHSLQEEILAIDNIIGKNYSEKIWQQQWFKIDIDIRTLLHHIESPIINLNGKIFSFKFQRANQMNKKKAKFLTNPIDNKVEFSLDLKDLAQDILNSLNTWAKKYLELIDENESLNALTGYNKDGRIKSKKVTLKELKKIAHIT